MARVGRPSLPEEKTKSIYIGIKISRELWKKIPKRKKTNKQAYITSLIEDDVKEPDEQRNDT